VREGDYLAQPKITLVSRIFLSGDTEAASGVNDVDIKGVVVVGGVDEEDRDVSKDADD
jgi:hypothetical protein